MKVLFATSAKTWGGVKSWMVRVIGAMTKKGHQTVLVARGPGDFLEKAGSAGATVLPSRFGADYGPIAILKAFRMLRKYAPDVVITNISKEVRTYGVAARLLGIPVVARLGLGGDLPENFRIRFDYRNIVKGAIVPSHAVKNGIPAHLLDPMKIRVIHNGVAIPREAARPGETTGPVRFIYAGKISQRKGVPGICRAARRLLEQGANVEFHLAGEGELLEEMKRECAPWPAIRFYGHVSDLGPLLASGHVGVMHSSYEGFPNTLLEYMASGLAVVTTPVDGIPEMLEDGKEALFTPYGDDEALFRAFSMLASSPEGRARLGRAARLRAERDFEIGRQTDKILAYLSEVQSC